jgi:hypothetical protein
MNVVCRDADGAGGLRTHYAMIAGVSRLFRWSAAIGLLATAVACSSPPREPLQLERNLLTVENQSENDWSDVEIWLNTYYRVRTASIPAGGRFQAPLDVFVAGFGQRFDFKRMQIKDLRLTAKLPDGKPLELKKEFQSGGLAGALGGKR